MYVLYSKVKAGRLDVHPTEQALVVYYELEAAILGEGMSKVLSDKKVLCVFDTYKILKVPKDYITDQYILTKIILRNAKR